MDRIISLPRPIRRADGGFGSASTSIPKRHLFLFLGMILFLIICLEAIPYSITAQLICLIASFALAFCHLADTVFYQRSDQRLKAIIQASPNPIVVYNKQGYPQNLNQAFTQIFGWTLDELDGRCIPFVPEAEKPITSRKIEELFQSGRPVSFETRRLTKEGDIRDVIIGAAIASGRDNTPSELVVNITDITERKQFEDRLQQAQKMGAMGTLAVGIAHDFNNILSPLMGYSEMLMDDIPDDSPLHEGVAEILTAGKRAKSLVHQILGFSRQFDDAPKPIQIQPYIIEALKLIRASIPSTIQIHQEIDGNCGPVLANPTQIHQVVMNLAANAFHAMEDNGGELRVTLKPVFMTADRPRPAGLAPGKYAHLIVSDTGIGIDKHHMSKIFDPYFTTKEKSKGTGLGLSVVQGIIKSVGGGIKVLSELGRGSEFHIYWPLTKTEREIEKNKPQNPITGGTERILLVDDEASVLKMVRQMLERLGYQVTACISSNDALAAFKADPASFDLVFTDMTMPEMTGDLLAQKILAIRPSIPVLISTGYSNTLTAEAAKAVGIKGMLIKPASKATLAAAVREALDLST